MNANADYAMSIGGQSIAPEATFEVLNPATGAVVGRAPECTSQQLDMAMEAASKAFRDWSADEGARREALRNASAAIMAAMPDLALLLSMEQGKPVGSTSLGDAAYEVAGCAAWFRYYADVAELPREVIQDDATALVEVRRRALGVVAAITPWNFPLLLALWKLGPALLSGNTVVLKPSPFTPLTSLRLGEILQGVLPPGVLNVVSGGNELGALMTGHPIPRKVSFTGSVATGKLVAAAAAPDLKRLTLELGGNDAAIVLDDVDVDRVADGLFWGAFTNCGQICTAIKRVYVPESLRDDLVDALAQRARDARVGEGTVEGTQIGPVNNRPQFDRVAELVDDARRQGATVVTGGQALEGPGYFYPPTILTDVTDGVRVVDEEQFGPVLPVVTYRSVSDAVERANASHFGLSGSVWSSDPERAAQIATQLDCGTAWVNTHLDVGPHQPFGGYKWSGLGVENGQLGLLGFTEAQVLYRPREASQSSDAR